MFQQVFDDDSVPRQPERHVPTRLRVEVVGVNRAGEQSIVTRESDLGTSIPVGHRNDFTPWRTGMSH